MAPAKGQGMTAMDESWWVGGAYNKATVPEGEDCRTTKEGNPHPWEVPYASSRLWGPDKESTQASNDHRNHLTIGVH